MSGLVDSLKKTIQIKNKRIELLRRRNSRLNENISALHSNITGLNGTVSESRETISRLNRTISELSEGDFLWGAASASFQIEGNPTGKSIWDTFCEKNPSLVDQGDPRYSKLDPAVSCNSIELYPEDIKLLKEMGLKAYRLSISWCRLFDYDDNGVATPKTEGIKYYQDVFKALKDADIVPIVTLFHWDLPQKLEDLCEGWTSGTYATDNTFTEMIYNGEKDMPLIVHYFADYAEFCFRQFPDIQYWGSINEAQTYAVDGNEFNWHAPGIGQNWDNSPTGREYRVMHNMIIAHGVANERLNKIRAERLNPLIYFGMMNNGDFGCPLDDTDEELVRLTEIRNLSWLAWANDPLFFGKYPQVMIDLVPDRLPTFTPKQVEWIKGSSNIMYINTYTSKYVGYPSDWPTIGWMFDFGSADYTKKTVLEDGVTVTKYIGKQTESTWNFIVPSTMKNLICWYQYRYSRPDPDDVTDTNGKGILYYETLDAEPISLPVMITENGLAPKNDTNPGLNDPDRKLYYESYLSSLGDAVNLTNIQLIGYLAWSLCDNFEWSNGYTQSFGLCYVNVNDANDVPRTRALKNYAKFFTQYVKDNTTGPLGTETINEGTTYGPTKDKDYWYYKSITPTGEIAPLTSSSALPRGR